MALEFPQPDLKLRCASLAVGRAVCSKPKSIRGVGWPSWVDGFRLGDLSIGFSVCCVEVMVRGFFMSGLSRVVNGRREEIICLKRGWISNIHSCVGPWPNLCDVYVLYFASLVTKSGTWWWCLGWHRGSRRFVRKVFVYKFGCLCAVEIIEISQLATYIYSPTVRAPANFGLKPFFLSLHSLETSYINNLCCQETWSLPENSGPSSEDS